MSVGYLSGRGKDCQGSIRRGCVSRGCVRIPYDQPFNSSFCQKIESIQYNACLAITGAIKGTSREKIYHELGIESLRERRWLRRLCLFFKIVKGFAPAYLSNYLPNFQTSYNPARQNLFASFFSNTSYFSGTFFPYCVTEWNKIRL